MVHNFYSLSIHTLILEAFIIQKQEQTLCSWNLNLILLLITIPYLKVIGFII
jgi:hypothetical protein